MVLLRLNLDKACFLQERQLSSSRLLLSWTAGCHKHPPTPPPPPPKHSSAECTSLIQVGPMIQLCPPQPAPLPNPPTSPRCSWGAAWGLGPPAGGRRGKEEDGMDGAGTGTGSCSPHVRQKWLLLPTTSDGRVEWCLGQREVTGLLSGRLEHPWMLQNWESVWGGGHMVRPEGWAVWAHLPKGSQAAGGWVLGSRCCWGQPLPRERAPVCALCLAPSLQQASNVEALLRFSARRICVWELDVHSLAWEQLQDVLDLRSNFEQTNGAVVWFEVIRWACLSHLPLPGVAPQGSETHVLLWLHHHEGAVSARSSLLTITPFWLNLLWGKQEWEEWRMHAFLFPEIKRFLNSNKPAIYLIATVNLEVTYTISYFCKERVLKNENNFSLMNLHIPVEFQSFTLVLKVSVKLYS